MAGTIGFMVMLKAVAAPVGMAGSVVVAMVMRGTAVLMLEAVVVAVVMEGTCSCYGNRRDC